MASESTPQRSGFEPELGGFLRNDGDRSGFEPELGGMLRQKGVYVDETTCIGCKHCAHTAPNTFYIEEEHGRARAFRQDGDSEEVMQEAIDTCPVDCIQWLDYTDLKEKETARKYQVIRPMGLPQDAGTQTLLQKQNKDQSEKSS